MATTTSSQQHLPGAPARGRKTRRRELCARVGVPNTGRQWRKLRKRLGLATWRKFRALDT